MDNSNLALVLFGLVVAMVFSIFYFQDKTVQADVKTQAQLDAEKRKSEATKIAAEVAAAQAAKEKMRADALQAEKDSNDFILTTPLWNRPYYYDNVWPYYSSYPYYYPYYGGGGRWRGHHGGGHRGGRRH